MFCGKLPCECNKKPAKPTRPAPISSALPKPKHNPVFVTPVQQPVEPEPTVNFGEIKEEPTVLDAEQTQWRNALQALAPLLSAVDQALYRDQIHPKLHPSVARRVLEWRRRNNQ